MEKTCKRLLSLLLVMVMVLSMVPANVLQVFATEEQVQLPEVEVTDITNNLEEGAPDLTFALNFKIKDLENLSQEYLDGLMKEYASDWMNSQFELTISGLEGVTDVKVADQIVSGANDEAVVTISTTPKAPA